MVLAQAGASAQGQAERPAAPGQPPAPKPAPASASAPKEYAGSEACAACHEDIKPAGLAYHKVLETNKRYGRAGQSCEACHGPGKDHAESADINLILSFKKASPARANQACLTCHSQAMRAGGRFFDAHSRNSMDCTSCHTVHHPKARPLLSQSAKEGALCASCHLNVKAEFSRPFRHKLHEGMVGCLDCHNPHGTERKALVRSAAANDVACVKCHGDKRGPFVFEHPPMRLEGCAACHEPHGSLNPRLLKRSDPKGLCLECHTLSAGLATSPPSFHDIRTPRFASCTNCHVKVHGSNVNRGLLR
jgi:DmsE family decaheme c-type cytochrome